jgi:hypothetical protein
VQRTHRRYRHHERQPFAVDSPSMQ